MYRENRLPISIRPALRSQQHRSAAEHEQDRRWLRSRRQAAGAHECAIGRRIGYRPGVGYKIPVTRICGIANICAREPNQSSHRNDNRDELGVRSKIRLPLDFIVSSERSSQGHLCAKLIRCEIKRTGHRDIKAIDYARGGIDRNDSAYSGTVRERSSNGKRRVGAARRCEQQ